MNKVKKGPDGKLDAKYALDLINFAARTAKKKRNEELEKSLAKRRELFKVQKWDEYSNIVIKDIEANEIEFEIIFKDILELLSITQDDYQQIMIQIGNDYELAQMTLLAQQGKMPSPREIQDAKREPKMGKTEFLKAFRTANEL